MFNLRDPKTKEKILRQAMREIENLLKKLEGEGKDLCEVKLKRYTKTHHISCICSKCKRANQKNDPYKRGLREMGFKVFFSEKDPEKFE
ncbi:MAG: hypothetical protein ACI86H_000367 [bacterium]|jgi:hypothetical protein